MTSEQKLIQFIAVVKAYQYTSITSVMLLDCWAIPCVLLFTWLFLKTKYRPRKIVGVVFCVAGAIAVVFSDVHAGERAGSIMISNQSLFSSVLFAITLH